MSIQTAIKNAHKAIEELREYSPMVISSEFIEDYEEQIERLEVALVHTEPVDYIKEIKFDD